MRGWVVATIAIIGAASVLPQPLVAAEGPTSGYESKPAFPVPGTPPELNKIGFVRHRLDTSTGAPSAVLILVPGLNGGAEDFRYVGEQLAARLPWLEIWAVDRRNNFLENRCGMKRAREMKNPWVALAYYFPLDGKTPRDIGCPAPSSSSRGTWNGPGNDYELSQDQTAALGMGEWGLATQLNDLRLLVAYARSEYPGVKVFLGGHSLGGMSAQLYAGWRFGSSEESAGWHTIDGLVLIDGGVDGEHWLIGASGKEEHGRVPCPNRAESPPGGHSLVWQYAYERCLLNNPEKKLVYWDNALLFGKVTEIAAMAASLDGTGESFLWPIVGVLFHGMDWPDTKTCPTNKAIFAFYTSASGRELVPDARLHQGVIESPADAWEHMRGHCNPPHEDRQLVHWEDFDQAPGTQWSSTDEWARALWQNPETNAVEWYFSIRLQADVDLASNLDSGVSFTNPTTGESVDARGLEGHRELDTNRVAIPVYAFAASECKERFTWYKGMAKAVPEMAIVDRSDDNKRPLKRCIRPDSRPYAHMDPLFAAAGQSGNDNDFIATLIPWLTAHR